MYISDIQKAHDGKIELHFADELTNEECLVATIDTHSITEIINFHERELR